MTQLKKPKKPRIRAGTGGRGTTAAPRRPRAATAPDADTEQQILDAAHAVFMRRGTAGARMQEIAQEAGVNQALLHYYFRSKEKLADAVFQRAAGQLLPRVIEVMASDRPLREKVERVVQIEIDHLSRSPSLPGYIISELHHHPERARQLLVTVSGMTPEAVRPRVFSRLRQQLEAGVKAGELRPIPPEQFIVNLLSLCIFPFAARPMLATVLGLDEPAFERFIARRREQLADFVLGALRP